MNMQELYDSAINIMNSIKASGGNYATYDSMSVSVVLSESGKPFTGMNSATIVDGKLKSTCSEYNAITSMMLAGETKINKKWILSVFNGIDPLYTRISHGLANRALELAERYEKTLSTIISSFTFISSLIAPIVPTLIIFFTS